MTINDIINEVNVEFGNGQSLAVTDAVKQRTSYNKVGEKDENYTKTADLDKMHVNTKSSVENIKNYLKKKGVWEKVAAKQDFKTTDLVFKADGSCTVNFDAGGSITVPADVVNLKTAVKKEEPSIREKFKKMILGEDVLEEGKPALQRDISLKAKPFLQKYGIKFDLSNYQSDGYLKAGGYKFWFDDEERDFRTNAPNYAGKGFADIRELLAYALDIKEAEKEHRNTWGLKAYLARSKPNKGYSNNLYKKVVSEDVFEEGAYSNGRYEHQDGKKVNKYHPGHANPIYTKTRYHNGKPETTRFGRTSDDWANVSHFSPNPMSQRYAGLQYGKDGTGTNYRKGEIPNGYMVWSDKDEREYKDAWEELIEVIKSGAKNERYKKYPSETFSEWSDGLYHFPKFSDSEFGYFSTKIQLLRAQKALAKLNKLKLRKNRIEKNNEKYDNSRSDKQIKKDARLWAKDKEHFDYVHNNGPKPVHTQSKEFRKKINGDVIRYEFESEKAAKKSKERSDRINYIKQKTEENKKKRYSQEAWDKRRARQELREDVLEEDVKSKIVAFLKTKLVPYAITTGLLAGATAGSGALIKHSAKSVSNMIKVLTANQEKVQAKVGNDTVSYDANKNVLTVNGKSEKAKEEIKDEWWDNFPDDTNVEFGDEKIGSDNLNTLSNAKLNMELIKPKAPTVSKMSVVTEGSHHSKYPPAINYKCVNNYLIKARKALREGNIEEADKWAWEACSTMHEDEMQGPGVAADVNAYNVFHKQLRNIYNAIIAAKKSKGEI